MTFRQCRFYQFLLLHKVGPSQAFPQGVRPWRLALQPGFVDRESIAIAQNDRSLDYILKLTNIPRQS